jgi:hypothetical protein
MSGWAQRDAERQEDEYYAKEVDEGTKETEGTEGTLHKAFESVESHDIEPHTNGVSCSLHPDQNGLNCPCWEDRQTGKEKRPAIGSIKVEFVQEGNTMGTTEDYEVVTIDLEFQGVEDDSFYVIRSNGWSFNDTEELQKLIDVASAPLTKIKEEFPRDKYEV